MAELGATPSRVTYVVLRSMRGPILVLLAVYATSMLGWVLIPGPAGHPEPMGFFHAFYFLTYTATTTGFGEIPYGFSDGQRIWGMVSLYAGVIAWIYAIGAIIRLFQNPHFQRALAERRFARRVAGFAEPFVIVCGFGDRGSLLTRGLSDAGLAAVVLDADPDRIFAVYLRNYRVPALALCADARVPDRLIEAGLLREHCRAVVALTGDEQVNAKVALSARLLNPRVRVVAQLTRNVHDEILLTLGGDLHIVDPFHTFARYLGATIQNPAVHMLNEWLIGAPNANLAMYADLPGGSWILCGFGRMGRATHEVLAASDSPTVVIDPALTQEEAQNPGFVADRANQRTLIAAGVREAAGIVAGTDSDSTNLGIAVNARALNPKIFVIVRQNEHRNQVLFEAARADLVTQPTLVSARRILFLLVAPLLRAFFDEVRERQVRARNELLLKVIRELNEVVGGTAVPRLWTVEIGDTTAPALMSMLGAGARVTLAEILRDPADRDGRLACVPLVLRSAADTRVLPALSRGLSAGDEVLLCGRGRAQRLLEATLHNEYTLRYLMTGVDEPRGYVMRWLAARLPTPHRTTH